MRSYHSPLHLSFLILQYISFVPVAALLARRFQMFFSNSS